MKHGTIESTLIRRISLSALAALLAVMVTIAAPPPAAQAFTFKVDTSVDNPALTACTAAPADCSLRGAISRANANPGLDTITFATVTNGVPIVLAGAANEDGNASGDLDILDGGDLTIQGNGATKTIVDGGGTDRVFHVCAGGGCANTVIFKGVTIRNGSVSAGGGGIFNVASATTVDGSTVGDNTAKYGGGIYNLATLNVTDSTIGGAGAGNQTDNDGGGIFNRAGTTTVDGSTVSANTAKNGGGIFNQATLKVQNGSAIGVVGTGNQATDDGGGIFNDTGGATTLDGSTVISNTASTGGGIYNDATLKVRKGSTIGGAGAGNQADAGGGIFNDTGTTTVDGSSVSANTAQFGGGIYNDATLTVRNGSRVSANTADFGGGIFNDSGTTTVDGSTVSANTAQYGGGIYKLDGTLNVTNSTIGGSGAGNQATIWGGGIHNVGDSTTTVDGSCILNNWAIINGGGLYNNQNVGGATKVTGSSIVGNSAASIFNNQALVQIATGNWWGVATGPNTPGADTVGGNVDTSGYLTEPTPGCVFNKVYLPLLQKHTT